MAESSKLSLERVARPALSILIGLGIGLAVEGNTDQIAQKKITTVEVCEEVYPLETKVTEAFHDCITEGVPNGTKIGGDKIEVGQPVAYVDAYVSAQRNEDGIEPDRIVLWGIAGAAIGAADFVL